MKNAFNQLRWNRGISDEDPIDADMQSRGIFTLHQKETLTIDDNKSNVVRIIPAPGVVALIVPRNVGSHLKYLNSTCSGLPSWHEAMLHYAADTVRFRAMTQARQGLQNTIREWVGNRTHRLPWGT